MLAVTTSSWEEIAGRIEAALSEQFSAAPARASISFLGVDPIEVLRYREIDRLVYCSLGMARQPMTAAAESVVDIAGPRAELLLEVADDPDGGSADIWKSLAIFAAAPAVESVVYGPGMTVDSGRPLLPGSRCTGALVVESGIADIATPAGLVSVLKLVPATGPELAWARVHGVRELLKLMTAQRIDLLDPRRRSVDLAAA